MSMPLAGVILSVTLMLAASLPAAATVIDFDSVPAAQQEQLVGNGFLGFDWDNIRILNPGTLANLSDGYATASLASHQNWVGYTGNGLSGGFSSSTPFYLNSALITAGWSSSLYVTITGYSDANRQHIAFISHLYANDETATLWNNTASTTPIESISFAAPANAQDQVIFSAVSVTPAVPEPESYALLGMGLLGMMLRRRLKSRPAR
ncbi:PEP-CTERM sorting domain-containing protein [Paludibacterium yongneupense]|uniref:PEP-CTERM sorting domain-containing protein n=1 Tax=Paludibacterium yongneupense TaxID=400061 RepID=UPI000429795A|nr:PEP-CTERM sorting domain-containing protein [Paludibacterium yongneupense]